MTIEHTLAGEVREKLGSAECRRLRKQGMIPANIHGHGKDSVSVKVPAVGLNTLIATKTRLFDLTFGSESETVMFQAVQWDAFGIEMQHVDFLRVDATEKVVVEIPLDIRGNSPGVLAGGMFELAMRRVEVECLAAVIPESIPVRIGALQMGESITISDLEVAAGVEFTAGPDAVVCRVNEMAAGGDDDDAAEDGDAAPAEPEVIGKKSEDDAADEG